ncbi:ferritin [Christensenellaceae bacterium OttesenSCG-928-K19]|nr:ferritin [Christensenellaceae bacterium OttesenSCG-928-K19]
MISKKMVKQMSEQMKNEFFSGYYYLSMAAWLEAKNLSGFANWFRVQAQEERDHAMKMMNYLVRVGAKVEFLAIEAPKVVFESPMDICKKTLEHEQLVTSLIYKLMDTAQEERDYKTIQFLQWYVDEQVEEEENASGLVERLKMAGSTEGGLLYVDNEMAARVYTPITAE